MNKKAILFDFDGTLVNTNDVVISSFEETYKHYLGYSLPRRKITECFGEPLVDTLMRELPDVPIEESIEYFRHYQRTKAYKLIKIFPEIKEMLKELTEQGYRLAIVTSRTTESTVRYLDMFNLRPFFELIVSCDDTTIHKPEPEPVLLALKKLGIEAKDAIMVGDGPFDIAASNAANVDSVLVGWRITEGNDLITNAIPTYEIKNPMDLLLILHM